jgi:LmbE family N-acetylglucosaminyl deacetylase
MLDFLPRVPRGRPLRFLCIGAHSDDLEIGCAGALLELGARYPRAHVRFVVLSAIGERATEARRSATRLLGRFARTEIVLGGFRDGYFPATHTAVKDYFEQLKKGPVPDVVFTHRLEDRHQDHRLVAELTWNTWRNHTILEYEIPKYEGDLGHPNVYLPLKAATARRKVEHLMREFGTQRSKAWFTPDTFQALLRLRGIECQAPSGFAEAFHARKICI